MSGQMIMYIGIAVAAVSVLGEIAVTIIFKNNKKKMIQKIYESYDN